MFSKSLGAAAIITLLAAAPLYFVSTAFTSITLAQYGGLLLILFLANLASAGLDSRLQRPAASGETKRRGRGRERGNVKWFNTAKGFGFITRDSGDDVFVHFRGIRGRGRRALRDGQRVEFCVNESPKGLQADDVAPVK